MKRFVRLVAGVGLVVALAGCGEDVPEAEPGSADGSTAASTETSATEGELSTDDVRTFFEALASNSVSKMEGVKDLAAPGSIAELYLTHQTAVEVAARDGGTTSEPDTFAEKDGGYEGCTDPDDPATCAIWADVTAEDGKIAAFTVNGESLQGRLLAGNGRQVRVGQLAKVKLVSAYRTATGSLFIALEVRNTSSTASLAVESRTSYRTKEGRQRSTSGQWGPPAVQADSIASLAMAFPDADLGGELTLHLFDENNASSDGVATIKLR